MSTVMTEVEEAAERLLDELECEDESRENELPPRIMPTRLPTSSQPPALSTPDSRTRV